MKKNFFVMMLTVTMLVFYFELEIANLKKDFASLSFTETQVIQSEEIKANDTESDEPEASEETKPNDTENNEPKANEETKLNDTESDEPEAKEITLLLSVLLESNLYADWLEVASCDYATKEQIVLCAQKCASIKSDSHDTIQTKNEIADWAYKIATAIANNPNATSAAIKELANSSYYNVWYIAAQSEANDGSSLEVLATQCASIKSDSSDTIQTKNKIADWAYKIATAIANNPNATSAAIKELANSFYYNVWYIAAQSEANDESSLEALAAQCTSIKSASSDTIQTKNNKADWAYNIATAITNNKKVTATVLIKLASSNYTNINSLAHKTLESLA